MSKNKPNSIAQTLFEVDAIIQHKGSTKKEKSSVSREVKHSSTVGLGINYGDFSEYIKKGRGNNINWKG